MWAAGAIIYCILATMHILNKPMIKMEKAYVIHGMTLSGHSKLSLSLSRVYGVNDSDDEIALEQPIAGPFVPLTFLHQWILEVV